MAELIYSTIHPVRAIFMIVKLALSEKDDLDSETVAGMAAWAANDLGWSVEEIAAAMRVEDNHNVIADLVYNGNRLLKDAEPGRAWLRHVAGRSMVYDRMSLVVIVTDRQEGPAGLQRSAPDDGSSTRPA